MASKVSNLFGKLLLSFLVVIMIAGVAVWGLNDILTGSRNKKIAKVGNEAIMDYELEQAFNQKKMQLAQSGINNISEDFKMVIRNNILVNLIGDRLLNNEFNNLNMQLNAKDVLKSDYLSQANVTKEMVADLMKSNGGETYFLNRIVKEKKIDLLQGSITSISPVLDVTVNNLFDFENQARNIEYVELGTSVVKDDVKPSETELMSFYEKRKNEFLTPEYRSFSYIVLDKSLVADAKDKDDVLEQLHEISGEVIDKVAGGSTLEEVAKEYELKVVKVDLVNDQFISKDGKSAGKLPAVEGFTQAVFSAEEGEISDILESDDATKYALVRVDNIEEKRTRSIDEVKGLVTAGLQAELKAKKLLEIADGLKKDLDADKTTLEKFAAENGISVKNKDDIKLNDSFISPEFTANVFATETGRYTDVQKSSKTLVIAKVKSVKKGGEASGMQQFTYKSKVQEQVSEEIMAQYLDHLKNKYNVKVYSN